MAYALPKNIAALKRDLGKYRIDYDVWFHESTLHESGAVLAVVDKLLELGACYKAEDGAIMYRSAQYAAKYGTVNKKKTEDGTEEEAKDEVLVRANGIPTYFAADIAYHYNKLATRGFAKAIDVWGADHHGHVARMKGAMDAIGLNPPMFKISDTHYAATWLLDPRAPKVEMPPELKERIARMKAEAKKIEEAE